MAVAATAGQLGRSWPEESPFKEELELLRESDGMRQDGTMIRQALKAGKASDWSSSMRGQG